MTRGIRQAGGPVAIAAGVIGVWEIALRLAKVPGYVAPLPSAIVQKTITDWPVLATGIATTLAEAVAGFLLGNLTGFALAVLLFYRPALRRFAMLPMVAANSVPAVAFAPVIILWLGSGMASKIVLVAFITAFIMLQNELQGLRQVDGQAVDVLRSFGARERRIFWVLRFPASLPYVFVALRLGSIRSVIIAIVAEMLGAYRGIGWVIFETTASMDYSRLWAAVAAASVAGVMFFALVSAFERRWVWWHVSVSGTSRRTRQNKGDGMSIKRLAGMAVAMTLLMASTAHADDKVSIRLKWLHQAQFAGYYVAKDKGFYKEEKLDVTINPGGPQLVAENLVASGSDDFAQGGGMETTLVGRDKGLPLVAIAAVFPKTPVLLVTKKDSGISKLEDFPGKKVSMWYTGTQYIVRAMLKNKGVDPASITEVPQPVTMAPFVRGEVAVACVTVFNELQTLISEGVGDLVLFDPADYGIVIPRDTIVTTDKMIKERPEVVQRFLRASLRGWKYAIENQPEAVEITLKQNPALKKDHQTIMMREVAKLMLWGPSKDKGVGYLDPKTAEFSMTFLLDNKQLTKPVPLTEATNARFWNEVPAALKVVR